MSHRPLLGFFLTPVALTAVGRRGVRFQVWLSAAGATGLPTPRTAERLEGVCDDNVDALDIELPPRVCCRKPAGRLDCGSCSAVRPGLSWGSIPAGEATPHGTELRAAGDWA